MNDDTFCFYCQKQLTTHRRFINHLKKMHYKTYAYFSYVPKSEWPEELQDDPRND